MRRTLLIMLVVMLAACSPAQKLPTEPDGGVGGTGVSDE
jgi:hypothetical protein